MNPNYNEFRFPQIQSHPWSKVFNSKVDSDAIDLVSCFLKYAPTKRVSGLEALGHPFFAEILKPDCVLPNGMHPMHSYHVS
jgi:glycogen synthase kinase 3 beta